MILVSCWQCGHHVAKTSRKTGVFAVDRSKGPAVVDTTNSGAVSPTLIVDCAWLSVADCGTTDGLRESTATVTTSAIAMMASVAYKIGLRPSSGGRRDG